MNIKLKLPDDFLNEEYIQTGLYFFNHSIFEMVTYVTNQNSMRLQTGVLNDCLAEATMRVQPPSDKGKRLKLYYMTQVSTNPPTFVIFCNEGCERMIVLDSNTIQIEEIELIYCIESKRIRCLIKNNVVEIKQDVKSLNGKSGKKWDNLVSLIVSSLVAAIAGYIFAHLGL